MPSKANLASVIKQSCMSSGNGIVIDEDTLKLIQKKLLKKSLIRSKRLVRKLLHSKKVQMLLMKQ